jgi:aspartate/methionine/tyrosine aminotransferase
LLYRTPENSDGYISMVVAENRLSTDLIVEGLAQHAADIPANMLYYQDARGILELRETIAHVLQRTFMKVGASSCVPEQNKWCNAQTMQGWTPA